MDRGGLTVDTILQVDIGGMMPCTEYCISVTACDSPLDHSLSSKKKPLVTSIQFTMPSVEELTDINGDHVESGFLEVDRPSTLWNYNLHG